MTNAVEPSVLVGTKAIQPVIRDCVLSDAKRIAEIYNESIQAGGATMDASLKTEADISAQIAGFSDRETILVYEWQDDVIGWGIIKKYSERLGYRTACETSVYLGQDYLRQGLGSRMKLALIERCKVYGYHHLVAKIFASNTASIAYNEKLGYEVVGIQKEIGFRKGKWVDMCLMQLILKDVPPYQPEID
jgi:phosphinothricin acetyltransferase